MDSGSPETPINPSSQWDSYEAKGGGATEAEQDDSQQSYSPKLTVRTKSDGNSVILEIENSGPGIPDEIKDKILQSFFTMKKWTRGTVLGLSIIKARGGHFDIKSKNDEGTTFTIKHV